jgi:hypothetical protein
LLFDGIDPGAIPPISADFVRTTRQIVKRMERNFVLTMMTTGGNIKDNVLALTIPDWSDNSNVGKMRSTSKRMVGENVIARLQIASEFLMLIPNSILHT